MLLSIGKLLALAVAGGGGISAYYLTRPSSGANQGPDCRNPYEIRLNDGSATFSIDTKKNAEEFLRETLQGKQGTITLKQNDSCPHWKSLPQ